jgi:protein-disulfide isomerase
MSSGRTYALVGAIAGVIAGLLIAVSVVGSGDDKPAPPSTVSGAETETLLAGIPQQGAALGRKDAPVTLVEFADLQCPFCGEWSRSAFPEIVRDYVRPGKVRMVFNGLTFIGPDSEQALRYAYAAGLQGKLWHTVDLLYANQGEENSGWVSDEFLAAVGAAIPGFDHQQAVAAESSPQVDARIQAASDAATALDVRSTPSFAAGKTGGDLGLVSLPSLTAEALRPALDSLLAK